MKKKEFIIVDLKWNDAYRLGHDAVDNEHKKLFQIARKAFTVVSPDKKVEKIRSVLKELTEYTKTHFENEEKFMERIGYPELHIQKDLHSKIISSMKDFTHNLSKMRISEIEKELAHLIEIWFIHHIIYVDKKITQWLITNQIPNYKFTWKNTYSIDNSTLDAEHQELFVIASEAFKKVPKEQRLNKIKETLSKLFEYFKKHFNNEEEYMRSIQFEKLEEHKKIHEDIIDNLNIFIKSLPKMSIVDIEEKLKNFIEQFLVDHILEEDKKIYLWTKYLEDLKEAKELKELV